MHLRGNLIGTDDRQRRRQTTHFKSFLLYDDLFLGCALLGSFIPSARVILAIIIQLYGLRFQMKKNFSTSVRQLLGEESFWFRSKYGQGVIASCKGACRHRGFPFVGVVIVFPFSVTVLRLYRGSLKLATVPSLGPLGCSLPPPFPLFFFLRGILLPLGSAQPPPPSADSTSGLFVPAWWALASLSELLTFFLIIIWSLFKSITNLLY